MGGNAFQAAGVEAVRIRVLDPKVAAKVAAGEVVERPASVVKELVENSLDAGAKGIVVEVRGGGIDLIRVTDDGEGIPVLDLELAVERHATSKISQESDLETISTLGFRGEALPSIAAVSRLTLTSRARGTNQGAFLRVRGGVMERKGAAGCPEGTSVTVEDLFHAVPARRKFLRSPPAEAARIHTLVAQLAMACPQVRFHLVVDGRESFTSPGNGSLGDALASVYGHETAEQLLKVDASDTQGRRVGGYLSPPSMHRANRGAINFYVNRRWIQSRLLLAAVEEAYRGLLMEGRHPLVVLHLETPAEEVDVNVHPTKREVRFHQESAVFSLVQRTVRETLVAQSPVAQVSAYHRPTAPYPWSSAPTTGDSQRPLPWESLIPAHEPTVPAGQPKPMQDTLPALRVLGQVAATYIVAEEAEGVYLIDQHAAHERVNFERVLRQAEAQQPEVQGLLEPRLVELLSGQRQILEEWREALTFFGFQGEPFGDGAYLLRGVPGGVKDLAPDLLLTEVLDLLSQARDPSQARESVAASIACHTSVRAGDVLSQEEMVALVRQLEVSESPHTCPHGRPTTLHLSANSLARGFGRR